MQMFLNISEIPCSNNKKAAIESIGMLGCIENIDLIGEKKISRRIPVLIY